MNNFENIKKRNLFKRIFYGIWFEYKALAQNKSVLYSNLLFPIVYYIFLLKDYLKL